MLLLYKIIVTALWPVFGSVFKFCLFPPPGKRQIQGLYRATWFKYPALRNI